MDETVKSAILVNLYWFSFPLIGYVLLILFSKWQLIPAYIRNTIKLLLNQNLFIRMLAAFVATCAVIGVITLVGYIFVLPVAVVSAWYGVLLAISLCFTAWHVGQNLFKRVPIDIFGLKDRNLLTKLVFVLMCLLVIADFITATVAKSHAALGSDTYVHLSRIVAILSQGLTIESGFFRNIPEVGYHMNLMYALYAVPAQLFNVSPSVVWEYSYGFFRLMQWVSIFSLAWAACDRWLKQKKEVLLGASIITLFAVGYFTEAFFIAVYPNQIVNIWLISLVLLISLYESGKKAAVPGMFIAAFLVGFTHPTYSLMAGMFIGLFFIVKLLALWKENTKPAIIQDLKVYGGLIAVLCVSPIRSLLFPNYMTETGFNLMGFPVIDFGFLSIKRPEIFYYGFIGTLVFMLGVIGFLFLLYKTWNQKKQWALVFALVMFFPLLVYIPFTFSILKEILPLWFIDRFTAMNVLNYIAPPIGIYATAVGCRWIIGKYFAGAPKWVLAKQTATIVVVVAVLLPSFYYLVHAPARITQYKEGNDHYYAFMDRTYKQLGKVLTDEKMIVAHQGDSYFLASVLPVDVLAIEEGHMSPAADAPNRLACQEHILKGLRYADLKAVSADLVVLAVYEAQFKKEKAIADKSPYLKRVASTGEYIVYQFLPEQGTAAQKAKKPYKPCVEYQKTEQK